MQDIDNLGWKLASVIDGHASETLLDSYHDERKYAALENIRHSSRTADFLTPRNPAHRLFRDAVLDLVGHCDFARPLVNSGRLSLPCTYDHSPLIGPDALEGGPQRTRPGSACPDAPVGSGYLLDHLKGSFALLAINLDLPEAFSVDGHPVEVIRLAAEGKQTQALSERYLGESPGAVYLIRPDQHVVARWRSFDAGSVSAAFRKALGQG
jgi:3-(3-hydroxy-phenyl)propionate hydroxylase